MTELEMRLKTQLKIQEQIFKEELTNILKGHQKNLLTQKNELMQIISNQESIIKKQNKTLDKYTDVSTNWSISIDDKQMTKLGNSQEELMERLKSLETRNIALSSSHKSLMKKLEALESKDKDLVEQLNALLTELAKK